MPGITPPTPAVLRAYRASLYRAGAMRARIGRPPTGFGPVGRSAGPRPMLAMLGASNPGGRRMPPGWNARMTARLRLAMRRMQPIEASGALGSWAEAMLLAPIDPRRAAVLARRFRQNAVLLIGAGRPVRLVLLPTRPSGA